MQAGDKSEGAQVADRFRGCDEARIRRFGATNDHYAVHRSDIGLDYLVGEAQAQALLGKAD